MNVIGISGLDQSIPFRQQQWPDLTERELRISQGHDSAAALIVDGRCVFAAAEERFSRKKHTGDFPVHAIRHCLAQGGLELSDVDELVHGFDYSPYKTIFSLDTISARQYQQVYSREALLQSVRKHLPQFPPERVKHVDHHMAHAASAYFTSGWDECLVLVIDGMGEVDSVSVYVARDGKLERIHRISALDSIGILYSLVTLHLGFDFNADEYKIMGLAPYGDPARHRAFFQQQVTGSENGSLRIPILRLNKTRQEQENYACTRAFLNRLLIPERHPDSAIDDSHRDIAAALQEALENTLLHLCQYFGSRTGLRKLALAGGVALNCTANGRIMRSGHFDEIYIQPAAGDDGTALGAALYRSSVADRVINERQTVPFLGPEYSNQEVKCAIQEFEQSIDVHSFESFDDTCEKAAQLIASGSVVAWYRG